MSATDGEAAGAATETFREADFVRVADEVGLNTTATVHEAFGASVGVQVLVWVNWFASVPPIVIPLMVSAAVPVFDSVTVWAAVAMLMALLNASADGVTLAAGANPFPVSATVGVNGSEVETESVAVDAPAACGVNRTDSVQVRPALSVAPQLLVTE